MDTTYICTPTKGILSLDSSQGLQPFKTYLWKEVNTPTKLIIENPLQATSFVQGADNDTIQLVGAATNFLHFLYLSKLWNAGFWGYMITV